MPRFVDFPNHFCWSKYHPCLSTRRVNEEKYAIIAGLNQVISKVVHFFKSRLGRNICFWMFLLYKRLLNPVSPDIVPTGIYYALVLVNISGFILLCYINNLILLPRLISRKKYLLYILSAIALSYLGAYAETALLKYQHVYYPKLQMFTVSIVASPMTNDLSLGAIYREMGTVRVLVQAFMIGFTGFWYINAYTQREKLMDEIVKKQVETELNFLKSQVNPHFLFNTLNNLYGLTLVKSDIAPEAILKLSSLLRYTLYESNVPLISFEKEKDMMQAYIDIEMLRLHEGDNMTFTIMTDSEKDIPPLLWLPILENVFKHGTTTMNHQPDIDFRFTIREGVLHIFSKNSVKIDRQDNKLEKFGGIGLVNLSKRLELLYPGKHSIYTSMENGYYTADIQITLQ